MAGAADDDPQEVGLADTAADSAAELGVRPVSDRLVRAVSRAKIAGALFASDERVKLGRYHLLELVGSGGMGVVWGAWDPELDRRVAIKLVKATMQSARDRILLEGQALAKLSHPNVVPVFDVGVVEEQVYLVMEWVKGKNLRAYCKEPRSVREIVAVYRDAALGLAAAHHAGLIHRDFKPDNAIRGDDGRVRVLDFGLARGETKPTSDSIDTPTNSSDLTRGAGTPRYMPPEQAQGGMLTPAVDQYAWCVSLREALVGRTADGKDADVPGWLDAIVARGTATDAKARFAAMDDLLRALARDPRTVWRRRAIVTGALGLAGAAFAIGTLRGGSDTDKCTGGKDEIAKTWNDQIRSAMLAHVGGLGEYGKEESKRLDDDLTKYAGTWAETHRAACKARARSELTPLLYERSVGCLARANVALETVIGVLSKVEIDHLPDAVIASRQLPPVERCATAAAGAAVEAPAATIAAEVDRVANDVERARVLAFAADPTAPSVAEQTVASAEKLAYQPLLARAELTLGLARLLEQDPGAAFEPLSRATQAALGGGDDATAVEAYAREVYAFATASAAELPSGATDVVGAVPIMVPIAARLGPAAAFPRTLLYETIGVSKMAAANRDEARVWFKRALDEKRGSVGVSNTELASVASNLALASDDPAERDALLQESITEKTELLGPNHPLTLDTRLIAAMLLKNGRDAFTEISDVCGRYVRYHAHLHNAIDRCAFEAGWLAEERGQAAEAKHWMSLVTIVEEPVSRVAQAYVLMLDGSYAEAAAKMDALGAEIEKEKVLWLAAEGADSYLIAASSWLQLGHADRAIAALEKSEPLLTRAAEAFPVFKRRLARTRAMLARALAGKAPARAKQLAADAADWYEAAGGYEAVATEMRRLAQ